MKGLKTLVALVALLPVIASAQVNRHRYDAHHRIASGVRHGSLTHSEAARLRAREARIRAQARRDRRDGHGLSYSERRRLQRERARTSRAIYRQKHDWNRRPH